MGIEMPASVNEDPVLWPGLELYFQGFMDLMASRQVGWVTGAIEWITIEQYCDRKELHGDQRDAMHYHIVGMDRVYLKHVSKKMKKS